MDVVEVKTADLVKMAAPYNPRKISDHDLQALRRSLKFFGAVEPVVVNKRTGHIVGGHQRVRAAEAEGIEMLPVVYVDLDEPSEKQLNLALNRISGEWDDDALARVIQDLESVGADLELTGFDEGELDRILEQLEETATADLGPAIENVYAVLITCRDEREQQELLERFTEEGLTCRSLMM